MMHIREKGMVIKVIKVGLGTFLHISFPLCNVLDKAKMQFYSSFFTPGLSSWLLLYPQMQWNIKWTNIFGRIGFIEENNKQISCSM